LPRPGPEAPRDRFRMRAPGARALHGGRRERPRPAARQDTESGEWPRRVRAIFFGFFFGGQPPRSDERLRRRMRRRLASWCQPPLGVRRHLDFRAHRVEDSSGVYGGSRRRLRRDEHLEPREEISVPAGSRRRRDSSRNVTSSGRLAPEGWIAGRPTRRRSRVAQEDGRCPQESRVASSRQASREPAAWLSRRRPSRQHNDISAVWEQWWDARGSGSEADVNRREGRRHSGASARAPAFPFRSRRITGTSRGARSWRSSRCVPGPIGGGAWLIGCGTARACGLCASSRAMRGRSYA